MGGIADGVACGALLLGGCVGCKAVLPVYHRWTVNTVGVV